MTLPYSRTVRVTLTRNQAFPSRRGFGTPIFLTVQEVVGELDATHRTKLYASMEEVAVDFSAGDEFYDAALVGFSQNPRPIQIKAGFVALDSSPTKAEFITELDALFDYDNDFYWICLETSLRDSVQAQGLIEWTEAQSKLALIDSNDVDTETVSTNSIAGLNKGLFERTGVFYHTDAAEYGAFALACRLCTFNFDEGDSAYTAKFKKLASVAPVDLVSSKITAITGFVPQIGQSVASGNMANTVVDIGGQYFVVEGSTLTANVFLDEIHATDWIIARTEENLLGRLLVNDRIPMADDGMETLAAGVREVMTTARRAGLVANDINPETGEYEAAVEITVPSVFDIPESQRKARIAPAIQCRFRYAGAVHYTTVDYQMAF